MMSIKRGQKRSIVEKISRFTGSLPARDLYVYLPPQYQSEPQRRFPVVLMQDGQNLFHSYAADSYTGATWEAALTADRLISSNKVAPFVIVGVAHGEENRIVEYLPPYASYQKKVLLPATGGRKRFKHSWIPGEAHKTALYYINELMPFLARRYRIFTDRQHIATCGSSMGGLFSMYLGWEFPNFARHHAALSASFWITAENDGTLAIANRIRLGQPTDMRLWLDSGTEDSPGRGDDNSPGVIDVHNALGEIGYTADQVHYYLDVGAIHSEAAWAKRLPRVLEFLLSEW